MPKGGAKGRTWVKEIDPEAISPPDYLTDDMRVSDLIHVLEHLPSRRNGGGGRPAHCTIDRGMANYLIESITARRGK